MNDPIVEEVRRIRDAHAAMFDYDLDAIFQDIKEQEKKSGCKFVSFASVESAPCQPQPNSATIPASSEVSPLPPAPAVER